MTDIQTNRNDGESFIDFHTRVNTEQALRDRKSRRDRDEVLAQALRIETYLIMNVIDLSGSGDRSPHTGAYVIERKIKLGPGRNDETWFATIVDGKADHMNFLDRPTAILHALARQAGTADSHGVTARVTARALGFTATE